VGNETHKFLIRDSLEEAGITPYAIILEPIGRNTAAAALCAALAENDPDTLHLVRPSDHVIGDLKAWNTALAEAVPAAQKGLIVLFGITPDYPETGYGYILPGEGVGVDQVNRISSFKEKPSIENAASLIKEGALWNSGIFLYSPQELLKEAEILAPDLLHMVKEAFSKAEVKESELFPDPEIYNALPSEPFDRVIMEHTSKGAVVPCSMGWSDVGSWQALWKSSEKDAQGNVTIGTVVSVDTSNSYIRSDGPALAVLGMKDIAAIATKDAVLIAPRERTQEVKALVANVEQMVPNLTQSHALMRRPWGFFDNLAKGEQFQVKHIIVLPGRSLSLQMHHHRSEHWVVVGGTALVECGDIKKMLFPNESIYIPKGTRHRLTNPGIIDLHLIEVQSGDYLGEDDIVRYADNYGREDSSLT